MMKLEDIKLTRRQLDGYNEMRRKWTAWKSHTKEEIPWEFRSIENYKMNLYIGFESQRIWAKENARLMA